MPEFSFGWRQRAHVPMEAYLRRTYRDRSMLGALADRILCEFERAHRDFQWGAAGALFDLIDFIGICGIPIPIEMLLDFEEYARLALSGLNVTDGTKVPHPLARHRGALIKRLRYEHVLANIRSGLSRGDAALAAREAMPNVAEAMAAQVDATYRDFREVELAVMAAQAAALNADPWDLGEHGTMRPPIWPGIFYIPTAGTCEKLDWLDLAEAFEAISIPDDSPWAVMA